MPPVEAAGPDGHRAPDGGGRRARRGAARRVGRRRRHPAGRLRAGRRIRLGQALAARARRGGDAGLAGRGVRAVLVGAAADRAMARAIQSALDPAGYWRNGCRSRSAAPTCATLMAVLARCAVVVANDSGAMHVASAVGRPVVAIFGPTDERATAPMGPHTLVRHDVWCRPCLLRACPIDHRCLRASRGGDGGGRGRGRQRRSPHGRTADAETRSLPRSGRHDHRRPDYSITRSRRDLPVDRRRAAAAQAGRLRAGRGHQPVRRRPGPVPETFVAGHARLDAELARGGASRSTPGSTAPITRHRPILATGWPATAASPSRAWSIARRPRLDLDLSRSVVVGDRWSDVGLARAVGATAILVETGVGAARGRAARSTACAPMPSFPASPRRRAGSSGSVDEPRRRSHRSGRRRARAPARGHRSLRPLPGRGASAISSPTSSSTAASRGSRARRRC